MSEKTYEITAEDFDLSENEMLYVLDQCQYLMFEYYESPEQYRGFFHRQNESSHQQAIREIVPFNVEIISHTVPINCIGSLEPVGFYTSAPDTVKLSIICPLCDGRLHYSSSGKAPLYRRPRIKCCGCGATLIINCERML